MQPNRVLEIFPTSRAIREILHHEKADTLLPKMATIGEFEKKALIVPGKSFIDEDTRLLLLKEASAFESFTELKIDREFFKFLKNSTFLFGFFNELALEGVEIENLAKEDIYTEFTEHLQILQELRRRYHRLLEQKGYVDHSTLPLHYRLNHAYLKQFQKIILHQEGYLSRFEFELFEKIAATVPLWIELKLNRFSKKMVERYSEYGFELQTDREYLLDFSKGEILDERVVKARNREAEAVALSTRIAQTAYVKKRVYDYIRAGISPEKIAVILPRKDLADQLALFDDENNFNFAMGFGFDETKLYRKIEALMVYFQKRNIENRLRAERLGLLREEIDKNISTWSMKKEKDEAIEALSQFGDIDEKQEVKEIFEEELFLFRRLLPHISHYPFYKVVHLFMNRLAKRRLDDVRGGKITVMELLESRGVSFDGVIIVDFNEEYVPSRSEKDLFLSSSLRQRVGLPTMQDRENLQKYYYKRLIDEAKFVSISYVEDEISQPSRFLEELGIKKSAPVNPNLTSILFQKSKPLPHFLPVDLPMEYDFGKVSLSSTRLKSYLQCRRRYYFRYICQIKEAELPTEEKREKQIGVLLHAALKRLFETTPHYRKKERLLEDLRELLYEHIQKEDRFKFQVDLWLDHLEAFAEDQVRRFLEGYRIVAMEKEYTREYRGFRLTGKIDRIDEKEGVWQVLDYKTGKIPQINSAKNLQKSTDFQLQFYYLLAKMENEDVICSYYDLKNGQSVKESLFEEKLALLDEKLELLKSKEQNFTMTEDLQNCRYCPYMWLCNKQ